MIYDEELFEVVNRLCELAEPTNHISRHINGILVKEKPKLSFTLNTDESSEDRHLNYRVLEVLQTKAKCLEYKSERMIKDFNKVPDIVICDRIEMRALAYYDENTTHKEAIEKVLDEMMYYHITITDYKKLKAIRDKYKVFSRGYVFKLDVAKESPYVNLVVTTSSGEEYIVRKGLESSKTSSFMERLFRCNENSKVDADKLRKELSIKKSASGLRQDIFQNYTLRELFIPYCGDGMILVRKIITDKDVKADNIIVGKIESALKSASKNI